MTAYLRPERLDEALRYLAETGARVAAGCTDLYPATEAAELRGPILDITAIEALRGVGRTAAGGWRIGAAATWSDVIAAPLPPAFDGLKAAAREVGAVQIQNAGTVAGNLCNASPAADGVPPLLTLDAEVVLAGPAGERRLPLAAFVTGPRQTALQPGELVTAIEIPGASSGGSSRFLKLGARRYLVISIVMVAARLELDGGRVKRAAVAVGACSPVARRLPALEAALTGAPADGLAARVTPDLVLPALSPIDDIRASAAYRGEAAVELVARALAALGAPGREAAA